MLNQAQHDSLKKEDDDVPYNGVVKFTLFTMSTLLFPMHDS